MLRPPGGLSDGFSRQRRGVTCRSTDAASPISELCMARDGYLLFPSGLILPCLHVLLLMR